MPFVYVKFIKRFQSTKNGEAGERNQERIKMCHVCKPTLQDECKHVLIKITVTNKTLPMTRSLNTASASLISSFCTFPSFYNYLSAKLISNRFVQEGMFSSYFYFKTLCHVFLILSLTMPHLTLIKKALFTFPMVWWKEY